MYYGEFLPAERSLSFRRSSSTPSFSFHFLGDALIRPWLRWQRPCCAIVSIESRQAEKGKQRNNRHLYFLAVASQTIAWEAQTHTHSLISKCVFIYLCQGSRTSLFFSIEKYNGGKYRSKIKNPRLFPLFFSLSYSAVNGIVNVWSRTYICVPHLIYSVSCQSTIW
jgi:hypothetical protein